MSDKTSYAEFSNVPTAEVDTVPFYFYVIEGVLLSSTSLFMVFLILITSKLRNQKEYQIFILCILFDAVFGLAYISAGIHRLQLVNHYERVPLVSRWQCINYLHNHVFVFITPGAGILALLTSFDRFFSVFFPLKYIKVRADRYFFLLITVLILSTVPTTVLSYVYSYQNGTKKTLTECAFWSKASLRTCSLSSEPPES